MLKRVVDHSLFWLLLECKTKTHRKRIRIFFVRSDFKEADSISSGKSGTGESPQERIDEDAHRPPEEI
ncbi:hypothetical protein [Falsibacillus albus]|uniref:Uncharacterized protein n=1 Tax=Falsibacillus albus TaxID=2478915 RepID=A0A3L7JXZ8_9BACI|nr:hypothetical protein [Falsibacillus albus]RLQ95400.1 hypothetical protein D9X91_10200 [Falsibacillus albus]